MWFGTAMGFGDTWQNVMAVRGRCTVKQSYTYLIGVQFDCMTFVNMT